MADIASAPVMYKISRLTQFLDDIRFSQLDMHQASRLGPSDSILVFIAGLGENGLNLPSIFHPRDATFIAGLLALKHNQHLDSNVLAHQSAEGLP